MGQEDQITGKLVIGKYQNGNFKTIKTFNPYLFYSINKSINKKDNGKVPSRFMGKNGATN